MKQPSPVDPVRPTVTFDSYVIPESVKTSQPARLWPVLDPTVVSVGVIAVLTFVLGVMATLKFTGSTGQDVAVADQPMRSAVEVAPTALASAAAAPEVTRQQTPDLLGPSATRPSTIPDLERAVLQGLQPKRTVGKLTEDELVERAREAQAIVNRNKLRMLREGVLAGVYTVTARTEGGTRRLVLETINAGMTQQSMANLLKEAAAAGEITVPVALTTSNGDVDMDTMLFNLIQTSLATDGTPEGAEAALEMSRRAFAASSARTQEVQGQRLYTVEPGDSLAYISLQFYGRPNDYMRIFDANRARLRSPDLIQIGQRLIIPEKQ